MHVSRVLFALTLLGATPAYAQPIIIPLQPQPQRQPPPPPPPSPVPVAPAEAPDDGAPGGNRQPAGAQPGSRDAPADGGQETPPENTNPAPAR